MKELKETILITMMSMMFWGILYPQFSLTENSYLCLENRERNPEQDFFQILGAKKGELVVKSKLWEWLEEDNHKE
ncbi:MAG: hypothetical protein IKL51_00655 [Lachnospiraceae bacterium]|nr:hypothetical protein [Lachnospiraceae bacterium]